MQGGSWGVPLSALLLGTHSFLIPNPPCQALQLLGEASARSRQWEGSAQMCVNGGEFKGDLSPQKNGDLIDSCSARNRLHNLSPLTPSPALYISKTKDLLNLRLCSNNCGRGYRGHSPFW